MREIQIDNEELIELLENIKNWFNSKNKNNIKIKGEIDKDEYHTSEEYFKEINQEKHIGYPEVLHGMDLNNLDSTPLDWREELRNFDIKMKSILSSPNCAVKMYYPKGGFMGWHNNHNASGFNILLSYTENGNGFFRYKDPLTKKTITMNDKPGWTVKVGYYGNNNEPDKIYWHCARAYEDRLTLGFVIPDKNMWQMMCEDIQYDK